MSSSDFDIPCSSFDIRRGTVVMTRWITLASCLAWAGTGELGLGAQGLVPAEIDFDAYALVVQRNIFDPSRRPPQPERAPTPTPAPPPETLDLTGVVVQTAARVALFEGSTFSGSKAVREGQEIQGLRLKRVRTDSVLAADGPTSLTLRVGAQIAKPFGGAWKVAPRIVAAAAPASAPATAPTSSSSGDASSSRGRGSSSRDRGSSRDRNSSSTDRATPAPSPAPAANAAPNTPTDGSQGSSLAEQLRERRRRELGQ